MNKGDVETLIRQTLITNIEQQRNAAQSNAALLQAEVAVRDALISEQNASVSSMQQTIESLTLRNKQLEESNGNLDESLSTVTNELNELRDKYAKLLEDAEAAGLYKKGPTDDGDDTFSEIPTKRKPKS